MGKKTKDKAIFKIEIIVFIVLSIVFSILFSLFAVDITNFFNGRSFLIGKDLSVGLKVDVIDVGQADAIFVSLPDNKTMLIDSGDRTNESKNKFEDYMNDTFMNKDKVIDYLILTHSDADHVGNMPFVFDNFDVKKSYRPFIFAKDIEEPLGNAAVVDTNVYKNYVAKMLNEGCEIIVNSSGIEILGENYIIKFYNPKLTNYSNVNDYSPIIVISHFGKSICLTGDAELTAENEVLSTIPNCDVLKVGHHGSKTSTSLNFLNAVKPKFAFISCGENNKYGHPDAEIMSRLTNSNFVKKVFQTFEDGTLVFYVDKALAEADEFYVYGNDNDVELYLIIVFTFGVLAICCGCPYFIKINKKQ